jgi:mannose-1-phosphate guanylyltransferase
LQEYFDENNIHAIVNNEQKPLGTAGAVKHAEKLIDGTFLVLNSDIISSLDIQKFVDYHHQKKAFVTISLWPVKNVEEYGVVDFQSDGKIIEFVEKPKRHEAPSNLINAGAYCLEAETLDYIEKDRFVSMEMEVFPKFIDDEKPFYGHTFDGYWIDVGRHSSYIEVSKILLENQGLDYLLGKSEVKGSLYRSTVDNDCVIEEGAIIKSCIIYKRCKIGRDVHMENCIVADNCIIGDNAQIKNVVLGDSAVVNQNAVVKDKIIWDKPLPPGYPQKQIGNPIKD